MNPHASHIYGMILATIHGGDRVRPGRRYKIRQIARAASGAVNVPRCVPERTAGPRLTGSRRRFALPAQGEQGDVVSGVLASDQGSHHG
jgi:hypothetical protein